MGARLQVISAALPANVRASASEALAALPKRYRRYADFRGSGNETPRVHALLHRTSTVCSASKSRPVATHVNWTTVVLLISPNIFGPSYLGPSETIVLTIEAIQITRAPAFHNNVVLEEGPWLHSLQLLGVCF